MSAFDTEDLKTEINTIINKSGELMDTANASPETNTPRKSILKTPTSSFVEKNKANNDFLNHSSHSDWIPRPLTVSKENAMLGIAVDILERLIYLEI